MDITELIKLGIPFLAIGISISTIFITKRNLKKQLRLSKLEEILEIILFFKGYYRRLYTLYLDTDHKIYLLHNSLELPQYLLNVEDSIETFNKSLPKETVVHKTLRIKVLSDAYLPNSKDNKGLKVKIDTISDVYYHMYVYVSSFGNVPKYKNTKIPKPQSMENFLQKISNELIIEMGFGYKGIEKDTRKIYYEKYFDEDVEMFKPPQQ